MPLHLCLDPQDPFAEREVLVAYDRHAIGLLLRAAVNEDGDDILPDLADAQLADLRYEIDQAHMTWAAPRQLGRAVSADAARSCVR